MVGGVRYCHKTRFDTRRYLGNDNIINISLIMLLITRRLNILECNVMTISGVPVKHIDEILVSICFIFGYTHRIQSRKRVLVCRIIHYTDNNQERIGRSFSRKFYHERIYGYRGIYLR